MLPLKSIRYGRFQRCAFKLILEGFSIGSRGLELQADILAGIWAHHANQMKNIIEPGDMEEALNAASQIGDDRLQRKFQGTVVPDSFTHGSSEQRVRWFRKGYETGDTQQGDTFATGSL